MSIVQHTQSNCTRNPVFQHNQSLEKRQNAWELVKTQALTGEHQPKAVADLFSRLGFYSKNKPGFIYIDDLGQAEKRYQSISDLPLELEPGIKLSYQPNHYKNTKDCKLNGIYACIFECDSGLVEEQLQKHQRLGMPLPFAIYLTGGKSAHVYYLIRCQDVDRSALEDVQRSLGYELDADTATLGLNQYFRLPYPYKHQETGLEGKLSYYSGNITDFSLLLEIAPYAPGVQQLLRGMPFESNSSWRFSVDGKFCSLGEGIKKLAQTDPRVIHLSDNKYLLKTTVSEDKVSVVKDRVHFGSGKTREEKVEILTELGAQKISSFKNGRQSILRQELPFAEKQETRYLELDRAKMNRAKLITIKANTGKGKSCAIAQYLKDENLTEYAVQVHPSVSLSGKGSFELDIPNYQDKAGGEVECLSTTIHSLYKFSFNPNQGTVLYLSEVDEIIKILSSGGGTLKGAIQTIAIEDFRSKVKASQQVIIESQNIQPEMVEWFAEEMGLDIGSQDVYIVENTAPIDKLVIEVEGTKNAYKSLILETIEQAHKDGETVMVLSTGKTDVTALYEQALKDNPDLNALLITQDTSGEELPKKIIANPDEELAKLNPTVVFSSPSIKTGFSSNGYFDYQFVLISGNHLDANDCTQMVGRVRENPNKICQRFIHFGNCKRIRLPETPKDCLDRVAKRLDVKVRNESGKDYIREVCGIPTVLKSFDANGILVKDDDLPWLRLALATQIRSNITRNDLPRFTRLLMTLEGYVFEEMTLDEESEVLKNSLKEIEKEVKAREPIGIANATNISEDEIEIYREKLKTSHIKEDVYTYKRAVIKRRLGLDENENIGLEEVAFHDANYKALFTRQKLNSLDYCKNWDAEQSEYSDLNSLNQLRNSQAIHQLGKDLDIARYIGKTGVFESKDRQAFLEKIKASEQRVNALLGINTQKKDGLIIKDTLAAFGIHIKKGSSWNKETKKSLSLTVFDTEKNQVFNTTIDRIAAKAKAKELQRQEEKRQKTMKEVGLVPNESIVLFRKNEAIDGYTFLGLADGSRIVNTGYTYLGISTHPAIWIQNNQTGKKQKVSAGDVRKSVNQQPVNFSNINPEEF